jgi:hypothetical protein
VTNITLAGLDLVRPICYCGINYNRKEAIMPTLEIGQSFTTKKSKVTGVVQEVVKNANGSLRVRLALPNGKERWTTAK